jgi:hypothetical protein
MKYIKYFTWLLAGLSVIIILLFFRSSDNMTLANAGEWSILDGYLTWAYILLGIAVIAAVGLPLIYMLKNPHMLKKAVTFVGLLALIIVIAYLLASSDPLPASALAKTDVRPTPEELKFTDTGLITMYILLGASVLSILAGGILNMIRNR